MAKFEFKLPDLGEGVTEGEVVAWHVAEGDRVAEDQTMVEVMTDKATVTIGAPKAGKVEKLMAAVGAQISVGEVLIVIRTGNGSSAVGGPPSKMPAATAVGDIRDSLPGTAHFAERRAQVGRGVNESASGVAPVAAADSGMQQVVVSAKPLATPATRKLARELGIDLRHVQATGDGGRISKDDVLAHQAAAGATAEVPPIPRAPLPIELRGGEPAPDVRVPFVGMRRKIAERMVESRRTAAHFTFVEEYDVSRLMEVRKRLQPAAAERGVELTYLAFIIKATVAALKKHPKLNSRLDEQAGEIVMHGACHIGVAAATQQGLVVPVLRDADRMGLLHVASEVSRLGQAARDGKLTVAELSGSTFTISSLGKQAGLMATPIINPPNVGIISIHKIKERPVVRDGQIVIGHEMALAVSMDHRVVDGHEGAAFLYDVIAHLEEPALMLLDL